VILPVSHIRIFVIELFNVIYGIYTEFDMSGVICMTGWTERINETNEMKYPSSNTT
jgi:hypothetical protein